MPWTKALLIEDTPHKGLDFTLRVEVSDLPSGYYIFSLCSEDDYLVHPIHRGFQQVACSAGTYTILKSTGEETGLTAIQRVKQMIGDSNCEYEEVDYSKMWETRRLGSAKYVGYNLSVSVVPSPNLNK
jgi:hypothetical protein